MRNWLIVLGLSVCIHCPLLIVQAKWLWSRPHYQFFPVILIGFALLAYNRLPRIEVPAVQSITLRVLMLVASSVVLFCLGVYLHSGLIGSVSCLVAAWASVWFFFGSSGANELRGPFMFLVMVLPLPLNLDQQLISSLQLNATEVASTALDLRTVRHSLSGVIIRTATKSYMVEEACSGINSLFSATALMLGIGIYSRYGLFRILLTFMTTVLWVVVSNALRVFLVVYCDSKYGFPLEEGWRHDALGIFTYCFAVIMSLSTDQLWRFLLPIAATSISELNSEFALKFRFPFLRWFQRLMDAPLSFGRVSAGIMVGGVSLVFLAIGSLAIFGNVGRASESKAADMVSSIHERVTEDSLPALVAGWKRTGFERVIRGAGEPEGLHSSMWLYKGSGFNAVFSLDGYYPDWHDLAYCYAGDGWQLLGAENGATDVKDKDAKADKVRGDSSVFHTKLQLLGATGNHATVFFSCFDSVNASVKPPAVAGSFLRMFQQRLYSVFRDAQQQSALKPPIYQLQLIVEADHEFLPHEEEEFWKFFAARRGELLSQLKGEE
jgi:exosortase